MDEVDREHVLPRPQGKPKPRLEALDFHFQL